MTVQKMLLTATAYATVTRIAFTFTVAGRNSIATSGLALYKHVENNYKFYF